MKKIIVVIGATGNIGKALTEKLILAGHSVRAVARNKEKLGQLAYKGAKPYPCDILNTKTLTQIFNGADCVWAMIPPNPRAENLREFQKQAGISLATALDKTGVPKVVALSSVGAHLSEGAGVVQGLHDFERELHHLERADVRILRPGYFMENLFAQAPFITEKNMLGSSIKGDVPIPFVATRDIAQVASERLSEPEFRDKSVEYVLGAEDVSFNQITKKLSVLLKQSNLRYTQFTYQDTREALQKSGTSESFADAIAEFCRGINNGSILEAHHRMEKNSTKTTIDEFLPLLNEAVKEQLK